MNLPDLHIHTTMSDGQTELSTVVKLARRRKITIGVCDHISVYHQIFDDYAFQEYYVEVRAFDVLLGGELDVLEKSPISEENLARMDYVTAGVHHFRQNSKERHYYFGGTGINNAEYAIEAYLDDTGNFLSNYNIDILAHPTLLPPQIESKYDKLWNDKRVERLINIMLETDTALEISGHWLVPREWIIRIALEAGVRFATGSDAHRRTALFDLDYPKRMIEQLDIPDKRIFMPGKKV